MLLSGGRSVSMLLTMTYMGVQRVQGLGNPARSSLPGCGVFPTNSLFLEVGRVE
jgi:hypothetical protein